MDRAIDEAMTFALEPANGDWRVVLERRGERRELGGLEELIRYLQELATPPTRPPRGLR